MFTANNVSTSQTGMQVYRTNYPPNSTTGIANAGTDSVYFGVYPVNESSTYQAGYDYTGYPAGITFENWSNLYNRISVTTPWAIQSATKSTSANTFQSIAVSGYRHFVLGNLANTTYITPLTEAKNTITAFPNPATTGVVSFNSVTGDNLVITVFNSNGILMSSTSVAAWPYTLNVADYASGIYVVRCSNATTSESFKLNIIK
jgi:hypothetical protein